VAPPAADTRDVKDLVGEGGGPPGGP